MATTPVYYGSFDGRFYGETEPSLKQIEESSTPIRTDVSRFVIVNNPIRWQDNAIRSLWQKLFLERPFTPCCWYEESIERLVKTLNGESCVSWEARNIPVFSKMKINAELPAAMKRLSDENLRSLCEQVKTIPNSFESQSVIQLLYESNRFSAPQHPKRACVCQVD